MPFPGGLESTANGTLVLSLAAALLYLLMVGRPPSWRRTLAKTAAVGLLTVLAIHLSAPWLLVAALGLSTAGDAFLAQDGERPFLLGLASFLAAHVAYVVLFAEAGEGIGYVLALPWRLVAAMLLTGFAGAMLGLLWQRLPADMKLPVGAYVAAIVAMGLTALTMPAPAVVLGAFCFVLSDAILATERFLVPAGSPLRRTTAPMVWVLYYAAQVLIVLGLLE